jgi:anaerobic carbon-monoxide dehydrogenase iron sulfur subunit
LGSSDSRIHVHTWEDEGVSVPFTCRQCNNAGCARVCPTAALYPSLTIGRLVEYDPGICVGCELCTVACPFGAIRYDCKTKKVAKCDLCGGAPACVAACPSGAIEFQDAAEKARPLRQDEAATLKGAVKPEDAEDD